MPSLRAIRTALLLTQGQLADRAHLGATSVWSIESGRRRPSRRTANRLAAVLKVAPEAVDEFRPVLLPTPPAAPPCP
jgi:transcriptional regulator with XRE-family HTH domain